MSAGGDETVVGGFRLGDRFAETYRGEMDAALAGVNAIESHVITRSLRELGIGVDHAQADFLGGARGDKDEFVGAGAVMVDTVGAHHGYLIAIDLDGGVEIIADEKTDADKLWVAAHNRAADTHALGVDILGPSEDSAALT